jgi:hypothetical protein
LYSILLLEILFEISDNIFVIKNFKGKKLKKNNNFNVKVEQMRHVELERWQTFRLMLEKEQRYVEVLKKELHRSSSDVSNGDNYKLKRELTGAERRVKTLQDQLTTFNEIPVLYNFYFKYTTVNSYV